MRALREQQGLRQQDLSDKTVEVVGRRVYRAHISRYENGETFPMAVTFEALVRTLGCEPRDLLDEPEAGAA
jgi:transcriptional regulator with XRE-family HTH domain